MSKEIFIEILGGRRVGPFNSVKNAKSYLLEKGFKQVAPVHSPESWELRLSDKRVVFVEIVALSRVIPPHNWKPSLRHAATQVF